ncbi:PAS domain S-box protein [Pedobacter sp. SYP-B3415]|uniref:PAS domain S-box protein n=1 Tax=Pedobacter sp. SYP-B3415 TaxID=2496641 RepID=UPI00101DB08F|nr:PAS domain S-box protein [Pedobacter sp. SYP-B3415]
MILVKKTHPFGRLWLRYKDFVSAALASSPSAKSPKLADWQNGLFSTIVLYAIPISLLALIPSVILEYLMHHIDVVIFDVAAIFLFVSLVVARRISLTARKTLTAVMVGIFSLIQIMAFGNVTVGFAYLFGLNIFIGFQFPVRYAKIAIGAGFFAGLLLAANSYFDVLNLPRLQSVPYEELIIASFNLLFLNLVVVVLIHRTHVGFEQTMWQRSNLYQELQKELSGSERLNEKLAESEEHYKTLFFSSPLPKMIVEKHSNKLLQVNSAAVKSYGYSETELLSMNLQELTAQGHEPDRLDAASALPAALMKGASRFRKKDGSVIYVELSSREIFFNGRPAVLVISADMTERVTHLAAINHQNEHLREIAFMQAHVIRSPLTKIMSLTELMAAEQSLPDNEELLQHLHKSALELDQVVRQIIARSEKVLAGTTSDRTRS